MTSTVSLLFTRLILVNLHFVYTQIFARGLSIYNTKKTVSAISETDFDIAVTADMTPFVSVIVSHETAAGNLVSDTTIVYVAGSIFKNKVNKLNHFHQR